MAQNGSISARQRIALDALLSQPIISKVSKNTGIPRRLLTRWLSENTFKTELERQRRELSSQSWEKARLGLQKAIDTLTALMDSQIENIRLKASIALIEVNQKVIEREEILSRLLELEKTSGIDNEHTKPN